MNVFITGNLGYVGPLLCKILRDYYPSVNIVGYDTAFFANDLLDLEVKPEYFVDTQHYGDIRDIKEEFLIGIDSVIHLAAISNDPMGVEFENVTEEINRSASVRLAQLSINAGVKNFVYASSCSMYGYSEGGARKETDPTNPLTSYAKSKIGTEEDVKNISLGNMIFTSLRFATACGWSPRLRLDLVLNDFVASAISVSKITVQSDGSPWRPLIDVEDMARAIAWAILRRKEEGGQFLAVNAGNNMNNFQVKVIADKVAEQLPGTIISINENALPDKRSYAVDFSLFESLAPNFVPQIKLEESIRRLIFNLNHLEFNDKDFRNSNFIRLNSLRKRIKNNKLSTGLRWIYNN